MTVPASELLPIPQFLWWPLLIAMVPLLLTVRRVMDQRMLGKKETVADALHHLRDEGAKAFVGQLVYRLKTVAASGRSDYEFHFRRYDVWFEYHTFFYIFTLPVPTTYWDCIDSPGSREVVKKMLEEGGVGGLRVDWCISTDYGKNPFAPKWVLSCQWDRLELRRYQFGGR